jgi:hypothetical protein
MDKFEEQLDQCLAELMQKLGETTQSLARSTKAFHHSTKFDDQITTQPIPQGQVVTSEAPWSSYLEFGNNQAGPVIYPTQAKALHFIIDGQDVFVKHVKAHGPLPYMQPAAEQAEQQAAAIWETVSQKLDK